MLFLDHGDHTSKDPLAETILSDDGCLTEARFYAKGGKETACVAMVRGKKGVTGYHVVVWCGKLPRECGMG